MGMGQEAVTIVKAQRNRHVGGYQPDHGRSLRARTEPWNPLALSMYTPGPAM